MEKTQNAKPILTDGPAVNSARRILLYGDPGIGKSTAAAMLPKQKTIVIDCENGTGLLDVRRITITNYVGFINALKYIMTDTSLAGTKFLVIDGLDSLERYINAYICSQYNVTSIEQVSGGFGKGWQIAAEEFNGMLRHLQVVVNHGISVILIGHSGIQHLDPPDSLTGNGYDRYTVALFNQKKVLPILKGWLDEMLLVTYEVSTVQDGSKTKAVDAQRVIYTSYTAARDAKTRFALPEKMPLNRDSIYKIVGLTEGGNENG